jgi:hypothetical protein
MKAGRYLCRTVRRNSMPVLERTTGGSLIIFVIPACAGQSMEGARSEEYLYPLTAPALINEATRHCLTSHNDQFVN